MRSSSKSDFKKIKSLSKRVKSRVFVGSLIENRFVQPLAEKRDLIVIDKKSERKLCKDFEQIKQVICEVRGSAPNYGYVSGIGGPDSACLYTELNGLSSGKYLFSVKTLEFENNEMIIKLKCWGKPLDNKNIDDDLYNVTRHLIQPRPVIKELFSSIGELMAGFFSGLHNLLSLPPKYIKAVLPIILAFFQFIKEVIIFALPTILQFFKEGINFTVPIVLQTIKDVITFVVPIALQSTKDVITFTVAIALQTLKDVISFVVPIVLQTIKEVIIFAVPIILQFIKEVIMFIVPVVLQLTKEVIILAVMIILELIKLLGFTVAQLLKSLPKVFKSEHKQVKWRHQESIATVEMTPILKDIVHIHFLIGKIFIDRK